MKSNQADQSWLKETTSIEYLRSSILAAEMWGLSSEELIKKTNINIEYPQHQTRMPLPDMLILANALTEAIPDKPIAFDIGWLLPPTAYGSLGYALLCSETLEDCLNIMEQFWALISQSITYFSWETIEDSCVITLSVNPQLQGLIRRLWVEAALASWQRCFELLLGHRLENAELCFDFPVLTADKPLCAQLGSVRYDMPFNQFCFPKNMLYKALPQYNPNNRQLAMESCKQDIILNGLDMGHILAKVEAHMILSDEGYPSLDDLANAMTTSSRTLRRQLSKEGSGYKTILDQAKRRDSIRLLGNKNLSIQKISELLGYSDPANFSRIFRQWVGQTPNEFRKKLENQC